eukprot:scaffold25800_cov162-Cylindrotheca_fusiformis.AAC.3
MSFRRLRRVGCILRWTVILTFGAYCVLLLQVHSLMTPHNLDANSSMSRFELHLQSSSKGGRQSATVSESVPKLRTKNETKDTGKSSFSTLQNGIREGHVYEYITSGKKLWEHSSTIPKWMKGRQPCRLPTDPIRLPSNLICPFFPITDYFQWHNEQRKTLRNNPEQWDQIKYYLVECTNTYEHCGGTADRLGPLPFHVRVASSNNRLLLFHWTKPAPLEEFLQPPIGGIDWRVPDWLFDTLQQESATRVATDERRIFKFAAYKQARVLRVKFQSHFHGQEAYDARRMNEDEPSFAQIYHDLWRVFFTPVPHIGALIEQQMKALQLIPGRYIAVHLRALYGVKDREEGLLQWWSQNSINCATSKLPIHAPSMLTDSNDRSAAMPILFVSDSTFATHAASSYASTRGIHIVHRPHVKQPIHLEKAANLSALRSSDFYDTFVDLYMIGMSQCTAYNMGGFGRWGSLIGYNSSCVFQMFADMVECDFTSEGRKRSRIDKEYIGMVRNALFLPPMPTLEMQRA